MAVDCARADEARAKLKTNAVRVRNMGRMPPKDKWKPTSLIRQYTAAPGARTPRIIPSLWSKAVVAVRSSAF
jgi:hypothetical protein